MEPGLALMDEIGRTALTNAFIQFSRDNNRLNIYQPLYSCTRELIPNGAESVLTNKEEILVNDNDYNVDFNMRKCPSDPYIQKGFQSSSKVVNDNDTTTTEKYKNVPSMLITPASLSNSTSWQGGPAVQITINHPQQKIDSFTPPTSRSFTPSEICE